MLESSRNRDAAAQAPVTEAEPVRRRRNSNFQTSQAVISTSWHNSQAHQHRSIGTPVGFDAGMSLLSYGGLGLGLGVDRQSEALGRHALLNQLIKQQQQQQQQQQQYQQSMEQSMVSHSQGLGSQSRELAVVGQQQQQQLGRRFKRNIRSTTLVHKGVVVLVEDDGWDWLKYGQKKLSNSKYAVRHYFRVSYSDVDSVVFFSFNFFSSHPSPILSVQVFQQWLPS